MPTQEVNISGKKLDDPSFTKLVRNTLTGSEIVPLVNKNQNLVILLSELLAYFTGQLGTAATQNIDNFEEAGVGQAAANVVGTALSLHEQDINNPHKVTAKQINALAITNSLSELIDTADKARNNLKIKQYLTANTTYYVSPAGSDALGDGSQANPFATPQYCLNWLQRWVDQCGRTITIQLADNLTGYPAFIVDGFSNLVVLGNTANPTNCKILMGGGVSAAIRVTNSAITINGVFLSTPAGSGAALLSVSNSSVSFTNSVLDGITAGNQIEADMSLIGANTITTIGSAKCWASIQSSRLSVSNWTFTNTPAYSSPYFAIADFNSTVIARNAAVGACSGSRGWALRSSCLAQTTFWPTGLTTGTAQAGSTIN